MMKSHLRSGQLILMLGLLSAFLMMPGAAQASLQLGFYNITNNTTDTASQYSVTVYGASDNTSAFGLTVNNGQALFVFQNKAMVSSTITDVYFQDGTLLGISGMTGSSGVTFDEGATPADLPGGSSINPAFHVTRQFSADVANPHLGISQSSDWLAIRFDLLNGYVFSDVLAALAVGPNGFNPDGTDKVGGPLGLRVGIHVSGIGPNSMSDSFVDTPPGSSGGPPPAVPVPPSLALVLSGLGTFGAAGLRRHLRRRPVTVA